MYTDTIAALNELLATLGYIALAVPVIIFTFRKIFS